MKQYTLLILVAMALLIGCREDKEEFIPDDDFVIYNADVFGIVSDANGNALPSVSINVEGETTLTDANGVFKMKDVSVKSGKLFVKANKSGYFVGSRTTFPNEGTQNFVRIMLLNKVDQGTVDGVTGGRIDLPGDVRFTFPENSVVTTNGDVYTGTIHVHYQHLDPNDENLMDKMPGALLGRSVSATEQFLKSYGMMAVELNDDAGNKLQVAAGKVVTVDAAMPAGITNSSTQIPLWSFNEYNGIWQEESQATISNGLMSGSLSHFSWWNFDLPTEQVLVCVSVEYADDNPVKTPDASFLYGCICRADDLPGKPSVCGFTNQNGEFKARVPVGESFELKFYSSCGDELTTFDIGPFTTDDEIGPLVITPNEENISDISGRLIDCNGDAVSNGYIYIMLGESKQIIEVSEDGTFVGRIQVCDHESFDFTGIDIDNIKQSLTATWPISPVIDLGDVQVCDQLDEYLIVTLEGTDNIFTELEHTFNQTYTQISTGADTIFERSLFMSYQGQDIDVYTEASIGGNISDNGFFFCSGGAQGGNFTVTVITYEGVGGYIEGTFEGSMCESSGNSSNVSGRFRVIREE